MHDFSDPRFLAYDHGCRSPLLLVHRGTWLPSLYRYDRSEYAANHKKQKESVREQISVHDLRIYLSVTASLFYYYYQIYWTLCCAFYSTHIRVRKQKQLNPHFLSQTIITPIFFFNSFKSIHTTAYIQGHICQLILMNQRIVISRCTMFWTVYSFVHPTNHVPSAHCQAMNNKSKAQRKGWSRFFLSLSFHNYTHNA